MFRKIAAIFFAYLILSQNLVPLGIYTYYNLNKNAIAEKLCINKNRPQMHCNGHCYLSRQLKEAEQKEKQQGQWMKEKEEQPVSVKHDFEVQYLPHFIESGRYRPYVVPFIPSAVREILLPPEGIA